MYINKRYFSAKTGTTGTADRISAVYAGDRQCVGCADAGKSRTGIAGGGIIGRAGDVCTESVSGSDDDRNQYVCGAVLGKRRQAVGRKSICLCPEGDSDRLRAVLCSRSGDPGTTDEDLYQ